MAISTCAAGLLGKGSVELVTSVADRTSPVQRGKWVLMNILGIIPPDPPPNVPPLKEAAAGSAGPADHAAADGSAPRQSGLRELSQNDGPDRLRAREFRRHRHVAHHGVRAEAWMRRAS